MLTLASTMGNSDTVLMFAYSFLQPDYDLIIGNNVVAPQDDSLPELGPETR